MKLRTSLGKSLLGRLGKHVVFYREVKHLLKNKLTELDGTVLDVGCGRFPAYLGFTPGEEYVGTDIERTFYTAVICDASCLPFRDSSFSNAICIAVLEHVKKPREVLEEIHRVIRANGALWVSFPFLSPYHRHPSDLHRWTIEGASALCAQVGLDVVEVHSFGGVALCLEYLVYYSLPHIARRRRWGYLFSMLTIQVLVGMVVRVFAQEQEEDVNFSLGYVLKCLKTKASTTIS